MLSKSMTEPEKTVLFIGRNWPNPKRTAAGWRMMQLVNHFDNENFGIHFATTDSLNNAQVFEKMAQVKTWQIALNDDGFDAQIKTIAPDYVVFDRFMTEEQYGWRVRDCCPEAITILDTLKSVLIFLMHSIVQKSHCLINTACANWPVFGDAI
jgi:hypothetical protein